MKIISLMPSKCQVSGESAEYRAKKEKKNTNKVVFFFLSNCFIKVYTNVKTPKNIIFVFKAFCFGQIFKICLSSIFPSPVMAEKIFA